MADKTFDEREAESEAQEADLRARLAELGFDGPKKIHGSDTMSMFSFAFGGSDAELWFAVCLKCGAMVALGDAMERDEGVPIERGIHLHTVWHEGQ